MIRIRSPQAAPPAAPPVVRGTRPVGTSGFTAFPEQVLHFVYVEVQDGQLLLHAIDAEGTEFDQLLIQH